MADADVGEAAWFRIMPKLRVHTEGERVHEELLDASSWVAPDN